jgi:CRISPR-associated endoribonuclease Cas6
MPALLEFSLQTISPRPSGLLGIPLHGLVFAALEQRNPTLSARIHAAEVKPFRIGQSRWQGGEGDGPAQLDVQLGLLDDTLLPALLGALEVGSRHGQPDTSLRAQVMAARLVTQRSYDDLYQQYASGMGGRELHMQFLTPTTFRTTDLDMPFPVPKTVFYGLQRRWEAFSDVHFGPELNDWIGRAVRVRDFQLRPRTVHFKGARGASMTACVGEVTYQLARPGDAMPAFVRLLADYANYAGVGYKTTYGLGHVRTKSGQTYTPTP